VASCSEYTFMCFVFDITKNKSDVWKCTLIQHSLHIIHNRRLWDLNPYGEDPNIIKRQLTIIPTEDVELAFYNICGMSAARSWLVTICLYLAPSIAINIEYMHIVHPLHAVIPTEVIYFRINQAPGSGHACRGVLPSDNWFHPCQSCCVKVENIV